MAKLKAKHRIDVKVTFQCNNRCKFCVREYNERFRFDKSTKAIKMILRDSKAHYEEVIFTGGEPTIRLDIIELVSYAKKLGYKIQIQTNGRMFFYKNFCEEIISAGADTFAISIHGCNAKLHDYLTGIKGGFEQTTLGIKNLLSFGQTVLTNTVITETNYRFLPEISKFLINLGITQYQFAFPHISGRAFINKNRIIPRKNKIIPYLRKGIKIGIENKRVVRVEAIPYCFLKGYEECVSDRDIPDTKVFDANLVNSLNSWRKSEGKLKGPKCKECKYFQCCEGPWREYPELFGWKEFIPVR